MNGLDQRSMANLTEFFKHCEHCQGRRDERALVLSRLRNLKHKTAALLRKQSFANLPPLTDGQVRQMMHLFDVMVHVLIKEIRNTPIEHVEVILVDDDTPPTIH